MWAEHRIFECLTWW